MALPTIRQLEKAMEAAGLSRTQSRRVIHYLRADGWLAQEQPEKSGLLTKLKTALTGAK
jgi:DNA-binding FadR family transcriptional regulator